MLIEKQWVRQSLELHLYHGRIMREHCIFLEVGLFSQELDNTNQWEFCKKECKVYKKEFQCLLAQVIKLSNGIVGNAIVDSGELYTTYTYSLEEKATRDLNITIDRQLTVLEYMLEGTSFGITIAPNIFKKIISKVKVINQLSFILLHKFIEFQENLLRFMKSSKSQECIYISHMISEAIQYLNKIPLLIQSNQNTDTEEKMFYNRSKSEQMEGEMLVQKEKQTQMGYGILVGEQESISIEHKNLIQKLEKNSQLIFDQADNHSKEYKDLLTKTKNLVDGVTIDTPNDKLDKMQGEGFYLNDSEDSPIYPDHCSIMPLIIDHIYRETIYNKRVL